MIKLLLQRGAIWSYPVARITRVRRAMTTNPSVGDGTDSGRRSHSVDMEHADATASTMHSSIATNAAQCARPDAKTKTHVAWWGVSKTWIPLRGVCKSVKEKRAKSVFLNSASESSDATSIRDSTTDSAADTVA